MQSKHFTTNYNFLQQMVLKVYRIIDKASFQCYILLFRKNFNSLTIFWGCTVRFVSDLVGNPEKRFSLDAAQMCTHLVSIWP